MRRFVSALLVLVSALALLVSSTSLWLRHNVITTSVFVANAEAIVDTPAVRARIEQRVAGAVMAVPEVQTLITQGVDLLPPALQRFRPTVASGVESLVTAGVHQLLVSEAFRPITRAALASAQSQLVAGQPVRFTIGQAKALAPPAARTGLVGQVLALIPNGLGVTLLTPSDAPQLYTAIALLQDAWWWTGLLALLALGGALLAARHRRAAVIGWSVTTAALTAVLLVSLRVAPGVVLPRVPEASRAATSAVLDLATGSLRAWTLWLAGGALVVLAGALLWGVLAPVVKHRLSIRRAQPAAPSGSPTPVAGPPTAGSPIADPAVAPPTEHPVADPPPAARTPDRSWLAVRWAAARPVLEDGLARVGASVRAHHDAVRWVGVVVAAVLLLLWPSPTISTLIWVGALVVLYLGALQWLRSRPVPPAKPIEPPAPAPAEEERAPAGERTRADERVPTDEQDREAERDREAAHR